ncbi:MAG: DUF4406 domain-containing protein, partial [Planctomycetota bacterium]
NLATMCDYGTRISRMLKHNGIMASVYIPGEDFIRALCDGAYIREELFNNSQGFLERSDCMFVLPNWKESKGTKDEIVSAKEQKLPIFYTISELRRFALTWKKNAVHKPRRKK